MSPKWPGKFFTYTPRVPVSIDEDFEEPISSGASAESGEIQPQGAGGPLAPEDEAALVERARTDPEAFGQLYELYVDRVYSYVYHRVGNVQDAEDLTARTFYRALEKLDTYEDRGLPFSAWLFRIAHNLVANWHRDHSRRQVFSLEKLWWRSHDETRPDLAVEAKIEREELWDAINRLPEERRNLLLYKLNTTLSNLEIGELMNKSEAAIKSLYFRTLSALRKDLEARGWGASATTAQSVAQSAAQSVSNLPEVPKEV
uniref:Sigma-70 family RNA polymerase sigma factor n=1 Tax=Caldilinea aerophila TaxID=133453 RepID=A0A7C1K0D2_9CHLR